MPRQLDPGASPMHFFGSEVRHARTAAGMTQAELGGLLGYDASEVSKVEAGRGSRRRGSRKDATRHSRT